MLRKFKAIFELISNWQFPVIVYASITFHKILLQDKKMRKTMIRFAMNGILRFGQ